MKNNNLATALLTALALLGLLMIASPVQADDGQQHDAIGPCAPISFHGYDPYVTVQPECITTIVPPT